MCAEWAVLVPGGVRTGRYDSTPSPSPGRPTRHRRNRASARAPRPGPVARHPPRLTDIVRTAVLGSLRRRRVRDDPTPWGHSSAGSASASRASASRLDDLPVELHLRSPTALPVAEVARQVESAVRYALRRDLDREPDRVAIHIDGLVERDEPSVVPPTEPGEPTRACRHDQRTGGAAGRAGAGRGVAGDPPLVRRDGPDRGAPGGGGQPRRPRRRDQRAQRVPGPGRRHRLEHGRHDARRPRQAETVAGEPAGRSPERSSAAPSMGRAATPG